MSGIFYLLDKMLTPIIGDAIMIYVFVCVVAWYCWYINREYTDTVMIDLFRDEHLMRL